MKILIDMGHPAHVHFFKNAIWELERRGHSVKVTARDKDVTLKLLEAYKIPFTVRPYGWRPLNLFKAAKFVADTAEAFGADRLAGVHNPYIARAASSLEKPSILFTDTPGTPFVNRISVCQATKVITPECLKGMFPNQVTYPGYKEMAYLHPSVFSPDKTVLERYGLASKKYCVVRFIKWEAYHDAGLNPTKEDVRRKLLSQFGKTVVSLEEGDDLKPEDLHSLLSQSSGCVSEGATLAKEAAVLGIPAVYVSPLAASLPPIMELVKAGRLNTHPDYSAEIDLPKAAGPMEMCDVTARVVREILE